MSDGGSRDLLHVDLFVHPQALVALSAEWDALEAEVSPRLPFRGAAWNILWWKHFRENSFAVADELRVFTVRDEARVLRAVFPMMLTRRPGRAVALLRMIQFFGSDPGVTESRGPVCRAADLGRVVGAVATALVARQSEWDEVQWKGLRADGDGARAVLDSAPGIRWGPPTEMFYLELPASWEDFKRARSRNVKESLRKCYNSLRRDGLDFSLKVVSAPESTPAALQLFFELHGLRAARQDTVPHPNIFESATTRAFLADYAMQLARHGGLRIFQLEISGQIVATRVGFHLGKELYLYYSGYRPEWAAYSVATTLIAEIFQWAIRNDLRIVNLSTGRDVSKTRWAPSLIQFESAEVQDTSAATGWRRRLYGAARRLSRDRTSVAGRWLAALRRNDFGKPER